MGNPKRNNLALNLVLNLKDKVPNNLKELADKATSTHRNLTRLAAYVGEPFRTYAIIQHNGTMEHIAQQLTHKGCVAIDKTSKGLVNPKYYIGELVGKYGLQYIPHASFIINEFDSGYVISLDDIGWDIMRTSRLKLPRYFMDYGKFLAE